MTKKIILFLFIVFPFLTNTVNAQVPDPYVPCDQTRTPEFHSLRPYQASPCNLNIENIDYAGEEAIICGNDLIAKDTFTTVYEYSTQCIPHPNTCPGVTNCEFHIPRKFWVSVNPYESRYPIAGNTELIPAGEPLGVFLDKLRLEEWVGGKLPPDEQEYTDFKWYWSDYKSWRGKICFPPYWVPVLGKYLSLCLDDSLLKDALKPNFWSNLFPYIPYSSTEDRIGKLEADEILQVLSSQTDIWDLKTVWDKDKDERDVDSKNWESQLYFPHMEENVELMNLLQSTYLSSELIREEQTIDKEIVKPFTYSNQNKCIIADVRSNPGDQLFGQEIKAEEVSYTAHFWCQFQVINTCPDRGCCPEVVGDCTKTNVFYSDIQIHVPLLEELWSKTVAGNASFLKKIYPKIGEDPLKEIEDVPGVAGVVHDAGNISTTKTTKRKVTEMSMPAEIYFPHLGGIYDYFLKAVQTAIRPKDFSGESAGLRYGFPIGEADRVNEYVSWYLNGTINRAEGDFLGYEDPKDITRITSYSGPLNKLLPQYIQWRGEVPQPEGNEKISRIGQIERSGLSDKTGRHNQIVACLAGFNFGPIHAESVPSACNKSALASVDLVPKEGTIDPIPPPGSGECPAIPDSKISEKYLKLKDHFIWFVGIWFGSSDPCAGSQNNLAEDCYNYVVYESEKAGVNPALSLAIWAHESAASNYCKNPNVEDFGVHYTTPANIVKQLELWLKIAKGSGWKSCYSSTPGWVEPIHAFLSQYKSGSGICDPYNNSFYYNMLWVWAVITESVGCLDSDGFKITSPTDNSCP